MPNRFFVATRLRRQAAMLLAQADAVYRLARECPDMSDRARYFEVADRLVSEAAKLRQRAGRVERRS
jgi:hypothetical protein